MPDEKIHEYIKKSFIFKVVTAEILMASETGCPLEVHKISIDRCDEMFDEDCQGDTWMPFYRDDQRRFKISGKTFP